MITLDNPNVAPSNTPDTTDLAAFTTSFNWSDILPPAKLNLIS